MTMHSAGLTPGATAADERGRIAALLAHYPDNSAEELADIHHWFASTASALDVGLLAADESVAAQYRAYRRDHYDRFSAKDLARAALFVAAAAGFIGAILWLMPA